MRSHLYNTCILLFLTALLTACGVDKNIKKGEKFFSLGEYYDAANEFKQAYQKTPPKEREKRGQISRQLALSCDKINSSQRAVAAYRNVIRYKQDDAETHFALARNLMRSGSYKEAEREFQAAVDSIDALYSRWAEASEEEQPTTGMRDSMKTMMTMAEEGIVAARQAPAIKQQGSRYTVKKMEIFNSRRSDYSPMLFGDQYDQLYWTSTRNEAQGEEVSGITGVKAGDIFMSEKDDKGKWGKPQEIASGLNTEYDEGTPAFSTDGREMYITQCPVDAAYPRFATIATSNRSDAKMG